MKTAKILESHGVKPSAQRLAIFQNLSARRDHPTADSVWAALSPTLPTLSRTTVYATLRLFCDKGLSRLVPGGAEMRFDAVVTHHAHFQCSCCGVLMDVPAPTLDTRAFKLPRGAKARSLEIFFNGFCRACAK